MHEVGGIKVVAAKGAVECVVGMGRYINIVIAYLGYYKRMVPHSQIVFKKDYIADIYIMGVRNDAKGSLILVFSKEII